jgi:CRISPR-associated endonuclease/helicase Cas3
MTIDTGIRWLTRALALPDVLAPFPWQARLLRRFVSGQVPRSLDLPTGLGKTSVMAVWLVARALGAALPRRLVYVVDRRAVVDQATEVAEGLRTTIESIPELRAALGLVAPLPISTLRGQHVDNRAWLADPASPAIVIGTLDMLGSRLLFSGYGVSARMRPYQAGMLGADALWLLDEAHLSPSFERLVERIASRKDADGRPLTAADDEAAAVVPPMRLMSLSATGRQHAPEQTFSLDDEDHAHPVVRARLNAPKRIRVFDAVGLDGLPDALVRQAWTQCAQGRKPVRTIVFVDRRMHAVKIVQGLRKAAEATGGADIELLVGGRRVHERGGAARRLAELGFLAGNSRPASRPAFLVATSAGEVGVDLDADHAVCDLVAWERMVQRLGRVNRRGAGDASVIVVPSEPHDDASRAMQASVLDALQRLPYTADGALDGSPASLAALKAVPGALAAIDRASTPAPLYPPLTRALVEAWAMTSLERHTGRPEVGPWIRGWPDDSEPPQTCLVWRRHLPIDDAGHLFERRAFESFLDAAGPHLSERLEIDVTQVADWLAKRAARLAGDDRSEEGGNGAALRPEAGRGDPIAVLIEASTGHARALSCADVLRMDKDALRRALIGCTALVACEVGGLSPDGLLDDREDRPADDVTEIDPSSTSRAVPFRVERIDAQTVPPPGIGWRSEVNLPLARDDDGVTAWLAILSAIEQPSGSEEGRSSARRAQRLDEHQSWAEDAARKLAGALGLRPYYVEVLAAAARVHDEGKRADRWQSAFHAPNRGRPPFAKTVGRPDFALLDGYRHEFGSLPYAEADHRVSALAPDLRELCLHLVAAHHGAARPVISTDGAEEPPSRAVGRARAVALRYAALSQHWGPWGLAWCEALLRAADQQASRRNDEEGANDG